MAANDPKTPSPFDPTALIDIQRRNLEAFMSAGEIVTGSMRSVAERQATMMQEAIAGLWGQLPTPDRAGIKPGQSSEQFARLRTQFEEVMQQFQEMSSVLMKAQAEALGVLNACAAANMKPFGELAPGLLTMQEATSEAMRAATTQVNAAVDEMRKRVEALQGRPGTR